MANKVVRLKKNAVTANLVADPAVPEVKNVTVPVKVVAGENGPVTFIQKVQQRYKAITALVVSFATFATQVQALTPFLPEGERYYFGIGVAVVGGLATLLVKNQEFVESL